MVSSTLIYFLRGCSKVVNTLDDVSIYVSGRPLIKLDTERLVKSLSENAKIQLQDQNLEEIVRFNLESLKTADMNLTSRYISFKAIEEKLESRAGIQLARRENPSLCQTPTDKPVFIIGLPRTGTTLLFNTLNISPDLNAPMLWEMASPLPADFSPDWRESKRFKSTARKYELFLMLKKATFDEVHEVRADQPEECHFLLHRSFFNYVNFVRLPSYKQVAEWFYSRDHRFMLDMYKFYKSQLQLVGHNHGMENRHFLLKSHLHNMDLPALLETFPDARLIFTYRKLSDVVPSFCSLITNATRYLLPVEQIDQGFGKRALRLIAELANRAADSLSSLMDDPNFSNQILLLSYDDLIENTPKVLHDVHSFLGTPMTKEIEEALNLYLTESPKNKHGHHKYSMAEYGITEEDIKSAMPAYIKFIEKINSGRHVTVI